MPGLNFQTDATGKLFTNNTLSKRLRKVGQPQVRFRALCDKQKDFGKRSGQKLLFDKISNLDADPSTGAIVAEGTPIPRTGFVIRQGTCTAFTSGIAVPWTEEVDTYSEIEIKDPIESSLSDHQVKSLDYRAWLEGFKLGKVVYTPTGNYDTRTATWSITGTAGDTATRDFTIQDLKNIVDSFKKGNYGGNVASPVPPWDGVNYFQIAGVDSCRAQKDDPEWEKAIYYGDPSRLFDGEEGRIYRTRTLEENLILSTINGFKGESVFCGKEAVMECLVTPEEIRVGIPGDFGRDMAMAWVAIMGFAPIWSYDATNEKDNRIVRVASL